MTVRMCPHCKAEISVPEVAAHSDNVECPKCAMRLQVGSVSRGISSLCGLAAAAIVWRLSNGSAGELGQVAPTLYAFLAFGIVSAIALSLTANLQNAPVPVVHEPVPASHTSGHGSGGHH